MKPKWNCKWLQHHTWNTCCPAAQGNNLSPEEEEQFSGRPQIKSVQRPLEFINYLTQFLPSLSSVCEPLRRLLDKDAVGTLFPQMMQPSLHVSRSWWPAIPAWKTTVGTKRQPYSEMGLGEKIDDNFHIKISIANGTSIDPNWRGMPGNSVHVWKAWLVYSRMGNHPGRKGP